MAYGDKILLGILGITAILAACCFIIHKIHSYRVNKYNNEVKNKLKNAAKYLFGEIYAEYFEDGCLCIPTRFRYNLFAKTIFIDKKDVKKMISFAEHVYKKYHCDYTFDIWLMAADVKRFARQYSSLDDYLYICGLNNVNTLNTITNKHKDEIIEIEKEKFFNMK